MSSVAFHTAGTGAVNMGAGPEGAAPVAAGPVDLVPNPATLDPMMMLYLCESKNREQGLKQGTNDIKQARDMRKVQIQKLMEAIKKAAKEKKKGGFWGKVRSKCAKLGKVAAIAAAVALAVGSCGAGAPASLAIVGAALSAGAMAQSEYCVLQKLGVSDEWAARLQVGMAAGGAICSGGASAGGATQAICSGVGGAATAASGAATIAEAKHESKARDLEADAAEASAEAESLKRLINQVIEDLEASDRVEERVLNHVRKAITTQGTGMQAVAMRV